MGFYGQGRGDYYRGDYYRGDPFAGKLLAKGLGWASKAVKRAIGGIRNDGARAARNVILATGAGSAVPPVLMGFGNPKPGLQVPGTGVTIHPGRMFPGGQDGIEWSPAKPRRMNPLNPRALKRALRRAEGFEKFAAKTVNALYRVIDGRKVRTYKKKTRSA